MTITFAEFGAFCFGVVIGWFVYFTNRYRKGEAQFSDITTLVGIIGGGALTALFGDPKTSSLFPAYCIGLAAGFFGYFVTLVVMVSKSKGAFTWSWFLDGRRRKPGEDEEILPDTRVTTAPMALQLGLGRRVSALEQGHVRMAAIANAPLAFESPIPPTPSPTDEALRVVDQAKLAVEGALRELMERIGQTTDPVKAEKLRDAYSETREVYMDLLQLQLKIVDDSPEVQAALAKLKVATDALKDEAARMKEAADAIATAAKVAALIAKVVGFLAPFI